MAGRRGPGGPLIAGAAIAVAALVALSNSSVVAPLREGVPDRTALLVGVTLTVIVGAILAVLAVTVVHLVRRKGEDPLTWGTTVRRALPIVLVGLALLALISISRTAPDGRPPRAEPTPSAGPGSASAEATATRTPGNDPGGASGADGSGTGDGPVRGSARLGDFDHDGKLDLGVDIDGDGTIDYVAHPADGDSAGGSGSGDGSGSGGGGLRLDSGPGRLHTDRVRDGEPVAGVDLDGDGDIDEYVSLDSDGDGEIDVAPGTEVDDSRAGELFGTGADGLPRVDRDGTDAATPGATRDQPGERPDHQGEDRGASSVSRGLEAMKPVLAVLLGLAVLVLLGGIVAGVVPGLASRRREAVALGGRDPLDQEQEAARRAMAGTMIGTIDSMLADPDPRTAIIGAYARLLEGLAACQVGRLAHEAPLEHLERALLGLRVRPEPLRRLIELFEIARFSTHPLTEAHRTEALDALRSAAADLAANAPATSDPASPASTGAPHQGRG